MLHFKKYFKRDLGLTAIQTMIRFYNKIRSESSASVNLDHKTSRKLPKMRLTIGSCPSHVPCFVALVLGAFSAKKRKKKHNYISMLSTLTKISQKEVFLQ